MSFASGGRDEWIPVDWEDSLNLITHIHSERSSAKASSWQPAYAPGFPGYEACHGNDSSDGRARPAIADEKKRRRASRSPRLAFARNDTRQLFSQPSSPPFVVISHQYADAQRVCPAHGREAVVVACLALPASHRIGFLVTAALIPGAIRLPSALGKAGVVVDISVLADHRIENPGAAAHGLAYSLSCTLGEADIVIRLAAANHRIKGLRAGARRPALRLPGTQGKARIVICYAVLAIHRIDGLRANARGPALGLTGALGKALVIVYFAVRTDHRIKDLGASASGLTLRLTGALGEARVAEKPVLARHRIIDLGAGAHRPALGLTSALGEARVVVGVAFLTDHRINDLRAGAHGMAFVFVLTSALGEAKVVVRLVVFARHRINDLRAGTHGMTLVLVLTSALGEAEIIVLVTVLAGHRLNVLRAGILAADRARTDGVAMRQVRRQCRRSDRDGLTVVADRDLLLPLVVLCPRASDTPQHDARYDGNPTGAVGPLPDCFCHCSFPFPAGLGHDRLHVSSSKGLRLPVSVRIDRLKLLVLIWPYSCS
jgi:hypothetical protein